MMTTCPICGTRRVVFWPEHWVFKRGETYYCSENCMMADQTKDMKLIRMIAHVRAQKGSKAKMARMKKDGTPAKKPGPKKKIETPEVSRTEATEVPEAVRIESRIQKPGKITEPVVYDGLIVREVEGNFGRYRRSDVGGATYIDFESGDGLDTLSLTVDQWRSFREENAKAAKVLGVEL